MKRFAHRQLSRLLNNVAFEAARTARSPDPDAVHDLRVASRRFGVTLRSFRPFLPAAEVKRVRKQLRQLRVATAAVRDRDIALDLFRLARVVPSSPTCARLLRERKENESALVDFLGRWQRRSFSARWRDSLGLA